MTSETRPWDVVKYLRSQEDMIAYLEAAFEDGHPQVVGAALNGVARAMGRTDFNANAASDIPSVVRQLKTLGFELTAKAAEDDDADAPSTPGVGQDSADSGERYLPREAREALTDEDYRRTSAKKRADTRAGHQHAKQPEDVAAKVAEHRES